MDKLGRFRFCDVDCASKSEGQHNIWSKFWKLHQYLPETDRILLR